VTPAKHLCLKGYKTGKFGGIFLYKNRGEIAFAKKGVMQADKKAANVYLHVDEKLKNKPFLGVFERILGRF
jgi:hypothetical protein